MFLNKKDKSIEKIFDFRMTTGMIPINSQGIDKLQIYENSGEKNNIDR
jgi:hypothetical protein